MDSSNLNIPKELVSRAGSFEFSTPVSQTLSSISRDGAVIINKNGSYYGIIDNNALYRSGLQDKRARNEDAGKYAVRVPVLRDSTSIDEAILGFYKSRAKALPYMSGNRVAGVISRYTMLKVLLSLKMLRGISASEAMTSPVVAIGADSTISQARAAMRDRRINRLIVLQGGDQYGIVTNYDIAYNRTKTGDRLPQMTPDSRNFADATVGGIAARDLVVVDYRKSLADASRSIVENKVSSIIVTRGNKPIGIITVLDIFGSLISRRKIEEQKIFVSGFDESTLSYEGDVKEALRAFMKKLEKFRGMKPSYVSLNIKKVGTKMYEMHARLALEGKGNISVHVTDYNLERTLSRLMKTLENELKSNRSRLLSIRRVSVSRKGMDEGADYED